MKVLLLDVDSKIPNLALMKVSSFYKKLGSEVTLKRLNYSAYRKRNQVIVDGSDFDKVFVSIIFGCNRDAIFVTGCEDQRFGGSGYNVEKKLPQAIEQCDPDYSIYPNCDTSIGFITRGCIRNCYFCIVPQKEGRLYFNQHPSEIIKHNKVRFLDNNILAYEDHKTTLQWLIDKKVKCSFNEGLDIRLINDENARLLAALNYYPSEYVFAFDGIILKPIVQKRLDILKKYITKDWKLKFFIYCEPRMDIQLDVLKRVQWCRYNKCLPYIMRSSECYESDNKDFYTDLASWCNQPPLFKKLSFVEFMNKRTKNIDRRNKSVEIYTINQTTPK
jgi:hypothetical protein